MADTVEIDLSENVWTNLSGAKKKGLLTNRSQHKIIIAEAASAPASGSLVGHILMPNDDVNLKLPGTQKLWGLSLHNAGVVSLTALPGFSKDKYFVEDFLIEVNKGNVPGHELVHWFGDNASVGVSSEDIWGFGGTLTYLQAAETMNVISSDTDNDISTGDGARSVFIEGLDGEFNVISEIVNLAATSTETVNSYMRIFRMSVVDAGTYGGINQGQITAKDSNAATVQSSIEADEGQSTTTHYTVPAGKTAYIIRVSITVESGKLAHIHIRIREDADIVSVPFKAEKDIHHWEGVGQPVQENFEANHILQEKTDVRFIANVTATTGQIQCDYDILLVDNNA